MIYPFDLTMTFKSSVISDGGISPVVILHQPPRACFLMVVVNAAATVTIIGTLAGAPKTEILTFSKAGDKLSVNQYDHLTTITVTGSATHITIDGVDASGTPIDVTVTTKVYPCNFWEIKASGSQMLQFTAMGQNAPLLYYCKVPGDHAEELKLLQEFIVTDHPGSYLVFSRPVHHHHPATHIPLFTEFYAKRKE